MVGERLQELRKDAGMTQKDLAAKLSISHHTISSYERDISVPDDEMKIRIAQLFDVSLDFLLGLTDKKISYRHKGFELPSSLSDDDIKLLKEFAEFLRNRNKK
ncbi:MAG: helix-turn-helix transcriptional regulator [Oscillospiraceae bacterium]|nr:helix-turn-helix transcriptional regulator [Oscillospiraceae bacterium]